MNSCVNSLEDGPVGPKHVEIRRYMNEIELVTYVGFSFHVCMNFLCCTNKLTFDRRIGEPTVWLTGERN